jgi:hypothetical protein
MNTENTPPFQEHREAAAAAVPTPVPMGLEVETRFAALEHAAAIRVERAGQIVSLEVNEILDAARRFAKFLHRGDVEPINPPNAEPAAPPADPVPAPVAPVDPVVAPVAPAPAAPAAPVTSAG